MNKFGRNYSLEIDLFGGDKLTVTLPFSMEFDITRNSYSSANISSIRIYNLSEKNRNLIRKDGTDYSDIDRTITVKAGYGDNLPIVFKGNISAAWSVREGVNFITQIESFDSGFAYTNSIINQSFLAGTEQKTIIDTMISSLKRFGVEKGAVGDYKGQISRANCYSGNTADILRDLTGGGFFIDNGIAHCLNDDEYIEGSLSLIDSSTGLLGTPLLEQLNLSFDMIFEPRLIIGQRIELKSLTAKAFNGIHKVVSVKHKGMISESIGGTAVTSVGMFAPSVLRKALRA